APGCHRRYFHPSRVLPLPRAPRPHPPPRLYPPPPQPFPAPPPLPPPPPPFANATSAAPNGPASAIPSAPRLVASPKTTRFLLIGPMTFSFTKQTFPLAHGQRESDTRVPPPPRL